VVEISENLLEEVMKRLELIEATLNLRRRVRQQNHNKRTKRADGLQWNAKLNPERVQAIRAMLALGFSQHKLARDFQVSRAAIQAIAEKKTWKHVSPQSVADKNGNSQVA